MTIPAARKTSFETRAWWRLLLSQDRQAAAALGSRCFRRQAFSAAPRTASSLGVTARAINSVLWAACTHIERLHTGVRAPVKAKSLSGRAACRFAGPQRGIKVPLASLHSPNSPTLCSDSQIGFGVIFEVRLVVIRQADKRHFGLLNDATHFLSQSFSQPYASVL